MPRTERELSGARLATPWGEFVVHFSSTGLARLEFPGSPAPEFWEAPPSAWMDRTEASVLALLAGELPVNPPPLDVSSGTEFQQRVWSALRKIPLGQTSTYGEIARDLGSPLAGRAVGAACGANPIPLLIPCHRVLAGGGKLGGFSGGLDWKRRLLGVEIPWLSPTQEQLLRRS